VRATKIIATVGPSSNTTDRLAHLDAAGVSMFRLNCSHLSTEELAAQIELVRAAVPSAAVLVDIQGPKLRTGSRSHVLDTGQMVVIGNAAHPDVSLGLGFELSRFNLARGERVLLDDGRVELVVEEARGDTASATVVVSGSVSARKGVNLPDTSNQESALTAKDLADLAVALDFGVQWVAVSFVESAADVDVVRAATKDRIKVMAKIERPSAVDDLSAIVAASDGVMAARGDLGVECGFENVPELQRRIAAAALDAGVVSVCATEMIESMVHASRPTRAEVNDVATAVRDGFDAVMLSAETAVGHDPVAVVEAMSRIVSTAERWPVRSTFADKNPDQAAVVAAAAALAARTSATAIVSLTATGYSAAMLSACRPPSPVIAVSPSIEVLRQLAPRWNTHPVLAPRDLDISTAVDQALAAAKAEGLVAPGDRVVICASRRSPRSDADTIWLHVVQ
jgi:pyruvate kinase